MERIRSSPYFDIWIFIIILISFFIQLELGIYNREANDDHIEVVQRIIESKDTENNSCIQCYHPKLYHQGVAKVAHIFDKNEVGDLTIIGQFINVFAGLIILIVVWLFISPLKYSLISKRIVFALVAFNPELISSNIQATNNSFAILFSVISIFCLWKYMSLRKTHFFIICIISTILAALSKGIGIILFCCIITVSIVYIFSLKDKKAIIKDSILLIIFISIFFGFMYVFSPYFTYWEKYKTPFVGNWIMQPHPKLIEKTYLARPGVLSVVDGYLTFRFGDLMKQGNIVTNTHEGFTPLRTSFWTLMYARTFSIHFPLWPYSWVENTESVKFITRATYVLAILPTSLVIIGFFVSLKKIYKGVLKDRLRYFSSNYEWLLIFFLVLMILLVIKLSYDTREFSSAKVLYIYPALLSFTFCFLEGYEITIGKIKDKLILQKLSILWLVFISLLIFDILVLLVHLAR